MASLLGRCVQNPVSVSFPGKKRYEGVRHNVISVTREWESNSQEKKRYHH